MTKDQFRRLALSAIDEMLSMPDDIWQMTCPLITLTVGDEQVVVGIKSLEQEEEAGPRGG